MFGCRFPIVSGMRIDLPALADAERTPLVVALLAILDRQPQRLQALAETVLQLRNDIALLTGQKPRPTIAPSTLDKPAKPPAEPGQQRPGSAQLSKKTATLTPLVVTIPFPDPPPGSVSHGYEEFDVRELLLQGQVTRYWRERLVTPDGHTLLAPLPADVLPGGHFGPDLSAFILYQYHPCHVTQPLLLEQLRALGIDISAGQINNFLTANLDGFNREKAALLTAGLAVSSYVGVDDTGARHEGHNGFCTALGNDLFAYFESTDSKSRLNFLQVLRGTADGYPGLFTAEVAEERREKTRKRFGRHRVRSRCREDDSWNAPSQLVDQLRFSFSSAILCVLRGE